MKGNRTCIALSGSRTHTHPPPTVISATENRSKKRRKEENLLRCSEISKLIESENSQESKTKKETIRFWEREYILQASIDEKKTRIERNRNRNRFWTTFFFQFSSESLLSADKS